MDVAMRVNPQDKMINKDTQWKNGLFQALRTCCSIAWGAKEQLA
jgi:hypothetical protein